MTSPFSIDSTVVSNEVTSATAEAEDTAPAASNLAEPELETPAPVTLFVRRGEAADLNNFSQHSSHTVPITSDDSTPPPLSSHFDSFRTSLLHQLERAPSSAERSTLQRQIMAQVSQMQRELLRQATEHDEKLLNEYEKREPLHRWPWLQPSAEELSRAAQSPSQSPRTAQSAQVASMESPSDHSEIRPALPPFKEKYDAAHSLCFLSAPALLPFAYCRWNTVGTHVFGVRRGVWLAQEHEHHAVLFVVLIMVANAISFAVLLGGLSPVWSWLSAAVWLVAPFVILQFNIDLLRHVIRSFDFLYVLVFVSATWFWLLPDLLSWDERTVLSYGWGGLVTMGLVSVDSLTTENAVRTSRQGWLSTLVGCIGLLACLRNDLLSNLNPRLIDIGITTIDT